VAFSNLLSVRIGQSRAKPSDISPLSARGIKVGTVFLSVILLLSISVAFSPGASAQTSPTITLNSDEFVPGQTVEVSGVGFSADTSYDIYVIRPDGWILKNDGGYGFDVFVSDENGSFVYQYPLVSVAGQYLVRVFDSSDIYREVKLATTTFINDAPVLSTDKVDYDPEDTVMVTGSNFEPGSYDIIITRPDGSIITGDGTFTAGFDTVTTDDGSFVYNYILNGIKGSYYVNAYDSSDTEHTYPLAKVGFYDNSETNVATIVSSNSGWDNETGAINGAGNCAVGDNPNDEIILSGFGFGIPTGATIDSIEVRADSGRSQNNKSLEYTIIKGVVDGDTNVLDPTGTDCTTSVPETVSAGNVLWGHTWTAEEINDELSVRIDFGTGSGEAYLDILEIEVTYTPVVGDDTPPEFDPISDVTLEGNTTDGFLDTAYTLPTATDAVDDNVDVVCSPLPDAFYPLGDTTVECTATDESGNSSEAAFMVTVEDTTPPEFDPISDLIVIINPDGTVDYSLPTATDTVDPAPIVECIPPPGSILPIGETTINCTATDDSGNQSTTSFTILALEKSIVTSSSLEINGFEQFRLIYTNDPMNIGTFQVTASNPGQTYYNVFATGEPGDAVTLEITTPRPYITKGSNPIHAYSTVDTLSGFYEPSGEVPFVITNTSDLTQTPSGAYGISLENYGNGFVTIMIEGEIPDTGLYYLNIHLDYGFKKFSGFINADGDAVSDDERIDDNTGYDFAVSCDVEGTITNGIDTVTNDNDFKKFRGIVVLATEGGIPIEGEVILLKGTDDVASAQINSDGLAFIDYHHKGKAAEYEVVLDGDSVFVNLSGKMPYAYVEFVIP